MSPSKAAGGADEAPRNGHPFARSEDPTSKIEVKMRVRFNHQALNEINEIRSSKAE